MATAIATIFVIAMVPRSTAYINHVYIYYVDVNNLNVDRINKDSDSDSEMERIIAALSYVGKIITAGKV